MKAVWGNNVSSSCKTKYQSITNFYFQPGSCKVPNIDSDTNSQPLGKIIDYHTTFFSTEYGFDDSAHKILQVTSCETYLWSQILPSAPA